MAFKLFSQDPISFPQEKRQQVLVIILVIAVLGTLAVLYFGFWRSRASAPAIQPAVSESATSLPASEPTTSQGIEDIINKIEFDVNFLKDPRFKDLKIYGEWPLSIEEKGRANPFLPY
jgi:flagellar basal body-associated protein FliL